MVAVGSGASVFLVEMWRKSKLVDEYQGKVRKRMAYTWRRAG